MIRLVDARILTRLESAGHMRTISAATSNTIDACCRSAAQPYTSARSSPSPQVSSRAMAAASSELCVCKHERPIKYRWDALSTCIHCIPRFSIGSMVSI